MGNVLSEQVSDALSVILEVPGGGTSINLLSGSCRVQKAKITPVALGNGLWLKGWVDSLEITVGIGGALGALFGSTPSAKAKIKGLHIIIDDSAPATGLPKRAVKQTQKTKELMEILKKLVVELEDIRIEMPLAGSNLKLQIGSLECRPTGSDPQTLSWTLAAQGAHAQVGDTTVLTLGNGKSTIHIRGFEAAFEDIVGGAGSPVVSSTTCAITLDIGPQVKLRIKDQELLAILNIIEGLKALAVADLEAARRKDTSKQTVRSLHASAILIKMCDVLFELHAFEAQLLSARSPSLVVDIAGNKPECKVQFSPLVVSPNGSAEMSSDCTLRFTEPTAQPTLQHAFASDGKQIVPWRNAVELLMTDARFQTHRDLLACLVDGCVEESVLASNNRKRQRSADDEDELSASRRRRI